MAAVGIRYLRHNPRAPSRDTDCPTSTEGVPMRAAHSITSSGSSPRSQATPTRDYVRVVRVRNGKHVSLQLMLDRLPMLEQIGLV
jgi:hypothetical protein